MTHFQVIESFGKAASLLSCRLETGRTHQIRIHLAEIGHPVVGDPVYGSRAGSKPPVHLKRQALHADVLAFIHPSTGEAIRVESPVPDDLAVLLAELRGRYVGSPS